MRLSLFSRALLTLVVTFGLFAFLAFAAVVQFALIPVADRSTQDLTALMLLATDTLAHLVAWKLTRGTLLIRVVTTRRALAGASEVALLWREDIDRLRTESVPDNYEVHLWVYSDRKGWHRYQVLAGGITEVEL